jgi:hypothetical protein
MALTPEAERELVKYVTEGREERIEARNERVDARKERGELAGKVDTVKETLGKMFTHLELHEQKDENRHSELKGMYKGLDSRVSALEEERTNTGRHNVEELKAKLKKQEKEKSERENRNFRLMLWIVGGVVGWIATIAATLLIAHLTWK